MDDEVTSIAAKESSSARNGADSDTRNSLVKIAKTGSANLLGSGLSAVAGFFLIIVITRGWSPGSAGLFFAVSSIFIIALALSQLGVDQGLIRFLAWNTARRTSAGNRHLVVSGMGSALAANALIVVAAWFGAPGLASVLSGGSAESGTIDMIRVFALALPVASTYEMLLAVTRGFAQMKPTVVVERIMRPSLQVALVILAAATGSNTTMLALAWVAPYLASLLCVMAVLARMIKANPDLLEKGSASENKSARTEFWHFTIPRGLARLAQVGLQRTDIALVTIIAGPAPAAIYTAVTRFLVLGQLATTAIQQVSEPHLAKLLAKSNLEGTKVVTRQLTLWTVGLAWPIYLSAIVFADTLLTILFGVEYAVGTPSLQILAVAMLFATAMGPLDMLLLMAGRSSLSLINVLVALAVDVVGCVLLIPPLGVFGAALAWTAAIVTRNVLCFLQVRQTLGITPASKNLALSTILTLVTFLVVPGLTRMAVPSTLMLEAAILLACCTVYGGLLWYWRKTLLRIK